MILVHHDEQPWEEWRPGVRSRAWATAATGAVQIRVAEQILDPGTGAPTHWHYFEENITVLAGRADLWVGDEHRELDLATTVVVPARDRHGFTSIGDEPLHILAAMSWPINEIFYDGDESGEALRAGELLGNGALRRVATAPREARR